MKGELADLLHPIVKPGSEVKGRPLHLGSEQVLNRLEVDGFSRSACEPFMCQVVAALRWLHELHELHEVLPPLSSHTMGLGAASTRSNSITPELKEQLPSVDGARPGVGPRRGRITLVFTNKSIGWVQSRTAARGRPCSGTYTTGHGS